MENIQYEIRLANNNDFEDIFRIYSQYFNIIFPSYELDDINKLYNDLRKYFDERLGIFNYWVMTIDNVVIGWQSLTKISNNPIKMKWRAESSTYFDNKYIKYGFGEVILNHVIDLAKKDKELYLIIAWLTANNVASFKMIQKLGFKLIGQISKSNKHKNDIEKYFIVYEL